MTRNVIFEPLRPVGENTYLYETPHQSPPSDVPSLVILCTWVGGATPRRINRYVSRYREIYATSSILLIATNISNTAVRSFRSIRASLQPACSAIRRLLARGGNEEARAVKGGILLHVFSHGGSNMAAQLALSMREGDQDQSADFSSSLRTVILDCCPGDDALGAMYRATELSMPRTSAALLFSKTLLYPSLSVVNGLQRVGILYGVRELRAVLNDPATFGPKARRLYMYTKEDVMVDWKAVQSHAEDARSRGYRVGEVLSNAAVIVD